MNGSEGRPSCSYQSERRNFSMALLLLRLMDDIDDEELVLLWLLTMINNDQSTSLILLRLLNRINNNDSTNSLEEISDSGESVSSSDDSDGEEQPSCSYESEKRDETVPQAGDDTEPLETQFVSTGEIKTEEIFIKEENNWDEIEDDHNLDVDIDYNIFGSEGTTAKDQTQEYNASSSTPSKVKLEMPPVTRLPAAINVRNVGALQSKNSSKVPDTYAKQNKAITIRKHFNRYKSDYLASRKPMTKFTQYVDEYHVFGQYIASGLRHLKDKRLRTVTQWKLVDILHEAQLSQFQSGL